MNKDEYNSDTNNYEYDEESFDNESFEEDISSDGESISEVSSTGQSMDELIPDNSSIKSLPDSTDSNIALKENFNDAASISSEDVGKTNSQISNNDANTKGKNEANFKKLSAENSHEIDESESEDTSEEVIADSVKSLKIQNEEIPSESDSTSEELSAKSVKSLKILNEVAVPVENPNLSSKDEDESISSSNQSEIEFEVTSRTPTSINSENYAFHVDIKPSRSANSIQQPRSRNAHRKSLSFSNERMREIERHNQILLRKILTQKPRKEVAYQKNQCPNLRTTTSAVNRKKQQRQIDLDNQVLKKKIEAIAMRRPQIL